jgi:hypothetical protein
MTSFHAHFIEKYCKHLRCKIAWLFFAWLYDWFSWVILDQFGGSVYWLRHLKMDKQYYCCFFPPCFSSYGLFKGVCKHTRSVQLGASRTEACRHLYPVCLGEGLSEQLTLISECTHFHTGPPWESDPQPCRCKYHALPSEPHRTAQMLDRGITVDS